MMRYRGSHTAMVAFLVFWQAVLDDKSLEIVTPIIKGLRGIATCDFRTHPARERTTHICRGLKSSNQGQEMLLKHPSTERPAEELILSL
jgi:hypothetical protein